MFVPRICRLSQIDDCVAFVAHQHRNVCLPVGFLGWGPSAYSLTFILESVVKRVLKYNCGRCNWLYIYCGLFYSRILYWAYFSRLVTISSERTLRGPRFEGQGLSSTKGQLHSFRRLVVPELLERPFDSRTTVGRR